MEVGIVLVLLKKFTFDKSKGQQAIKVMSREEMEMPFLKHTKM